MPIATISAAEVAALQRHGPIDLIDVRTPREFAAVHAIGARLMPLDTFDPASLAASRCAPPSSPIYLLCHSGVRAMQIAERCFAHGLTQVVVVDGGTVAWEAAGLPVERRAVINFGVERQVRSIIGLGVLCGAALGYFVAPAWIGVAAFFGAGLLFAGISGTCALAVVVARMPWNRSAPASGASCITGCSPALPSSHP